MSFLARLPVLVLGLFVAGCGGPMLQVEGDVSFVIDGVLLSSWQALGTINNGEVPGDL